MYAVGGAVAADVLLVAITLATMEGPAEATLSGWRSAWTSVADGVAGSCAVHCACCSAMADVQPPPTEGALAAFTLSVPSALVNSMKSQIRCPPGAATAAQ